MANYNLRRFSSPAVLQRMRPRLLLDLFNTYRDFFRARGLDLPDDEGGEVNYMQLAGILVTPGEDMPVELAAALWLIDEMSTPEAMDMLLESRALSEDLSLLEDPSPAEVAMVAWKVNPELLERRHAARSLVRPRSFEYFQASHTPPPSARSPTETSLKALEADLDLWFELKKRGRGSRVFPYVQDEEIWFLVRHGDPFRREGGLVNGEPVHHFFRPAKEDVLIYDGRLGDLRVNARSKGEKDLYRRLFGLHLFGDDEFFNGTGKYTLEPLRQDEGLSLVCSDVEGIEWVRLKELCCYLGGPENAREIYKADDVFAAMAQHHTRIPARARLEKASFLVKFTDAKRPRSVTVRPPNTTLYTRDSDSDVVESWLEQRGFSLNG